MRISDVLHSKGVQVVSVAPDTPVPELLSRLAAHEVGAAVVLAADEVVGIVSERDVVRRLERLGPALLEQQVADIMTSPVHTCCPEDSLDSVSVTMTEQRARHMPVLVQGRLAGIVSIGDVVKSHIAELEHDREQLTAYISQG
ncbi:CBS domain-containing protein [Rhodococcus sp. X156]|uniref:CBS domain-containing protein n=1 Tax=Rhodococcus sp. X156 TaxID=2499145 RepID=UPI000FDA4DCC|nr:CBS domain-containing protein [Rhodococcus sp. X156]